MKRDENLNIGADEGRTHFGLESVWGMLGGRRVAENRPVTPLLGGNYPLLKVRIGAGTTFNTRSTPWSTPQATSVIHDQSMFNPQSTPQQRRNNAITIPANSETTQNNP